MLHIKNTFKKLKRQKILSQKKERAKAPEKSVSKFSLPTYLKLHSLSFYLLTLLKTLISTRYIYYLYVLWKNKNYIFSLCS